MRSLRRLHGDVPVYLVDVVHSRPLSRYIAERVGVVHASPQAIILRAGVPAWHGSHFDLRAEVMARRLELLKGEAGSRRTPPNALFETSADLSKSLLLVSRF